MLLPKAILLVLALFAIDVFADKILLAAYYREGDNVLQAEQYLKKKSSKIDEIVGRVSQTSLDRYILTYNKRKGWKIGTHAIYETESDAETVVASMVEYVNGI
ncbi:hypothetical protein LX32DRAFT_406152 [Colletotrichum zoysiae]|uniref:Uncharacterized protein n=1 Tax=Colletotrichum zoysiae TaxID=1216348 RepID=A0AAD9HH70_9PEZI|nr:hypothetical protein LX32DRAFT_406152 [Colletotrichum zoysiae]